MTTFNPFRCFHLWQRPIERLAHTSADLHLDPGEFAVPEGGERALYAVISGKIEVVKSIDGVERRLGWRVPGAIFGEVPIVLGTPFPGGYRASEPSRVMRVEPRQYYEIAAASPEISMKIGALAREPARHRRRTAEAARHNGGAPLGRAMQQVAQLPFAQSDQL